LSGFVNLQRDDYSAFAEDDVPEAQRHFIALNAQLATQWPTIIERKEPPEDADEWNGKPGKLQHLQR
jgi:ferredoxin